MATEITTHTLSLLRSFLMSAMRSAMYAPAMWNGGYFVSFPAIEITYFTSPFSSSCMHVTILLT